MTSPDYSALAAWLERKVRWLRRRADSYVTLDPVDSDDYDKLDACAAALRECAAERDAYRRAKAENDERYMLERDAARRERDEARALGRELTKCLSWAQQHLIALETEPPYVADEIQDVLARARELGWLRR